jgi:FtsH-binding integral membrane protein
MRKPMKKNDLNFLLENKHYKRLHLFLYLISITLITLSYFLIIIIFSEQFHFVISVIFSLVIGLYIVMNRNKLVKIISDHIEDKKRKDYKKNLKRTLKQLLEK